MLPWLATKGTQRYKRTHSGLLCYKNKDVNRRWRASSLSSARRRMSLRRASWRANAAPVSHADRLAASLRGVPPMPSTGVVAGVVADLHRLTLNTEVKRGAAGDDTGKDQIAGQDAPAEGGGGAPFKFPFTEMRNDAMLAVLSTALRKKKRDGSLTIDCDALVQLMRTAKSVPELEEAARMVATELDLAPNSFGGAIAGARTALTYVERLQRFCAWQLDSAYARLRNSGYLVWAAKNWDASPNGGLNPHTERHLSFLLPPSNNDLPPLTHFVARALVNGEFFLMTLLTRFAVKSEKGDINSNDNEFNTPPLWLAIEMGFERQRFKKKFEHVSQMFWAVMNADTFSNGFGRLRALGVDLNVPSRSQWPFMGYYPIQYAFLHVPVMPPPDNLFKLFLSAGADRTVQDINGNTLLHYTVQGLGLARGSEGAALGFCDLFSGDLETDVHVNTPNNNGDTSLHAFFKRDLTSEPRYAILDYLLNDFVGANVEAVNKQGNTPMHEAALNTSFETWWVYTYIDDLLEQGAQDMENVAGQTVLSILLANKQNPPYDPPDGNRYHDWYKSVRDRLSRPRL